MNRILHALVVVFLSLAPLGRALTVTEMKEMEAQVKLLVAKDMPAVVSLMGMTKPAAGSGVVVSKDGLILTAAHVTQGNSEMVVIFPDGKERKCKVLGANYARDLSLTKIVEPGDYPFVELGDSDKLEATTMVCALGHPGGYDARRTPPIRLGRISMKNFAGFLVSDCTLIGGDSGGPLFGLDGKLVGIHSSISESLSVNRSAPVNAAKADWERLLAGENWGKLGGKLFDFNESEETPEIGATLGEASAAGVTLKEVHPKSPAEAAGLKSGDVVVKIGTESVKTPQSLIGALGKRKPGETVELAFLRGDTEQKASVTLVSQAEMMKRLGIHKSE